MTPRQIIGKIGLWSKADAQSLFDDLKAVTLVLP